MWIRFIGITGGWSCRWPIGSWSGSAYQMHDLVTGRAVSVAGARNYVELDPHYLPAHIFRLRRRVQSERTLTTILPDAHETE
jgi:hypothetical protein